MAKILLKNYLWLIDKLSKRPMSFDEISSSYERSSLFEPTHPLQVRTFYNWREKIDELFGFQIVYDGSRYHLHNYENAGSDTPQKWLIQSIAVTDRFNHSVRLKKRILFEDVPSGHVFLTTIIDAMESCKEIIIDYQKFSNATPKKGIRLQPYCVKMHNRRWYMLCHVPGEPLPENTPEEYKRLGCLKIYALDRIQRLEVTPDPFHYPNHFRPKELFADYFGVCIGFDAPLQKVVLRVYGEQVKYLRTLPLHQSQHEAAIADGYSDFEYNLHPTIDFFQAVMALGSKVEVKEPSSLRETMAEELERMIQNYRKG